MTSTTHKDFITRLKYFQQKYKFNAGTLLVASILAITSLLLSSTPLVHAAACSPPATTYGSDTMTVSVPSATTYSIWVNMQAPATSSNSIMLQVDGADCYNVGGSSSMPLNTWTWINYQNGSSSQTMQAQLPAGSNTLELIGTDPGVLVNNILILGDNSCVPTGTGTNCTTGQPVTTPVVQTTSSSGTTTKTSTSNSTSTNKSTSSQASAGSAVPQALSASGTSLTPNNTSVQITNPVNVSPTYTLGQSIKEVHYYINNKEVYTATKAPFTYRLNTNKLTAGKYVLTSKTVYTSGDVKNASETVFVSHSFEKNFGIYLANHVVSLIILLIIIGFLVWQSLIHERLIKKFIQKLRDKYGSGPPSPDDEGDNPWISDHSHGHDVAAIGSLITPTDQSPVVDESSPHLENSSVIEPSPENNNVSPSLIQPDSVITNTDSNSADEEDTLNTP